MEELFYSSGKIYVVIGVATIILSGIFAYLFWIDRKVSRMEKELKDKNSK
jgi:CcmD family protein